MIPMIRKLIGLALVLLIVAVVPEAAAHFLFQSGIAAAVAKRDPGAQHVSARVPVPMLPNLLTKATLSKVTVSARHVDLRTVTADWVTATATGVHVNLPSSLINKRAQITHVDHVHLTLTFTEEEASARLPPGFKFVFGKGTVTVQGLATSITGSFRLEPPARIVFTVVGSSVPGLTRLAPISFPVPPLAACVQSVALNPHTLTVTCDETNPSTDLLPHP
jgi:hypothetical protein